MLSTALLTAAWVVGVSVPASAADKGSLQIVSITDQRSGLGAPVQGRPFDVVVKVLDTAGQPMTVNQDTTIRLEEVSSGPGNLEGNITAKIERNSSSVTIEGAIFTQYDNGVTLRVRAVSGVNLAPDEVTVEVALTAVGASASPDNSLSLSDPDCAAPTRDVPNCGQLFLPNGAIGHVTLSVGSCEGLGTCKGLVVTALANLGSLYSNASPAKLVVACDKDLCRTNANGVPKIQLKYTLSKDEGAQLSQETKACPAKGVLGDEGACVDFVSSTRSDGDIYLHLLYKIDLRASF